jgi:hypothetical protein
VNCKQGDLAIVVRRADVNDPRDDIFIGAVRKLTTLHSDGNWLYEGEVLRCPERGGLLALSDDALKPIRPQGDDARDETLDWLPVPAAEPVASGALHDSAPTVNPARNASEPNKQETA